MRFLSLSICETTQTRNQNRWCAQNTFFFLNFFGLISGSFCTLIACSYVLFVLQSPQLCLRHELLIPDFPCISMDTRADNSNKGAGTRTKTSSGSVSSTTLNPAPQPGDRQQDYLNMFTTGSFYDCSLKPISVTGESKVKIPLNIPK